MKNFNFWNFLIVILLFQNTTCAFASPAINADLLPAFDNPKLNFGTGQAINNQPQLSPILPNISGQASQWFVAQWHQNSLMTGSTMSQNDPQTKDATLGTASYAFTAPDGHSHIWVYQNGPGGHLVYELFEHNGWVTGGGGSNIFLSANIHEPAPNLGQRLEFSMLAKVSHASISL